MACLVSLLILKMKDVSFCKEMSLRREIDIDTTLTPKTQTTYEMDVINLSTQE